SAGPARPISPPFSLTHPKVPAGSRRGTAGCKRARYSGSAPVWRSACGSPHPPGRFSAGEKGLYQRLQTMRWPTAVNIKSNGALSTLNHLYFHPIAQRLCIRGAQRYLRAVCNALQHLHAGQVGKASLYLLRLDLVFVDGVDVAFAVNVMHGL